MSDSNTGYGVPMTPTTVNEVTPLWTQILAGITRHGLSALSGVLVSAGALNTDQQSQFVAIGSGIVLWLGQVAWSAIQKRNAKKPV